jgi:hypothetical protein
MMGATWIFSILVICFHQVTVDFAVPIMALEDVPLMVAVRRVWSMAAANVGDFIIYLLIKAVMLAVISIALLFVELIVLIVPMVVIVVALVVMAKSFMANPLALVLVIGIGAMVLVTVILFLVAMVASPTYVFFQGYALEFFADRYPPLKAVLYPTPVAPVMPPLPAM